MAQLDKWLDQLADFKEQAAELDAKRKELEAKIIDHLTSVETDSVTWEHKDGEARATVVRGSTMKFDEAGLEDALGRRRWHQVSKRVLDQRALEDQVARGLIDVGVVAEHVTESARKPYIKVTVPRKK